MAMIMTGGSTVLTVLPELSGKEALEALDGTRAALSEPGHPPVAGVYWAAYRESEDGELLGELNFYLDEDCRGECDGVRHSFSASGGRLDRAIRIPGATSAGDAADWLLSVSFGA